LPPGSVALCIVADDRPGLLSFVSASLVAHDADITAVKAYTRTGPETGALEAVDFVWAKRRTAVSPVPFPQTDIDDIGHVLTALVTGRATIESVLRKDRLPRRAPSAATRVTLEAGRESGSAVMTVEADDRPGLLLAITRALFRAGIQIIDSDALTKDGRVTDRFTLVELDGTPISLARRAAVQRDVLSAIEGRAQAMPKKRSSRPPRPGGWPR
jgi:[protein-PII] uridylyltransferase